MALGTFIAKRTLGLSSELRLRRKMIASHRPYHFCNQVALAGCLVSSLGLFSPVFANDADGSRRHSLILRPAGERIHTEPAGIVPAPTTHIERLPAQRTVESSTTQTTTPTPRRKLTKRPAEQTTSAASSTHLLVPGADQPVPPAGRPASVPNPVAGLSSMPPTAIPNQRMAPSASLSTTRGIASPASAAPSIAVPAPPPGAPLSQPVAGIGIGSSSTRSGGSRSALSLFKVPGIMNLLQAPPPPLVTPPSTPPTTPPATPPTPPPTGSPPSTPPPVSPPSTPPPPPAPTTGSATLSWVLGSESDLAGYKIYVGTSSGTYNYPGSPFTVGKVSTYTITNLPRGQTYFFALSAYDNSGNNSPLSGEVSKSIF